ncbi:MAG: M48 family metalloprotease [Acidimicrobiales bacterium]
MQRLASGPSEASPVTAGSRALSDHRAMRRSMALNKRKALLVVAAPASVLALVVAIIAAVAATAVTGTSPAGPQGLIDLAAGLVAGSVLGYGARARAMPSVLRMADARPARPQAEARLRNLLEDLCLVAGMPQPALYLSSGQGANSLSVSAGAQRSCIVIASESTTSLNRVELEAMLAHEIAHLRTGDALVTTVVAALFGPLAARWPRFESLGVAVITKVCGEDREIRADLLAASVTRYPPALVQVLSKAGRSPGPAILGPLWIAPSAPVGGWSAEARMDLLGEL